MEQYIPKSALVAEIVKWISGWTERLSTNPSNSSFFEGGIEVGRYILSFIGTFEVKEVNLDKEIDLVEDKYHGFESLSRADIIDVAKHFFELGIKVARKGE